MLQYYFHINESTKEIISKVTVHAETKDDRLVSSDHRYVTKEVYDSFSDPRSKLWNEGNYTVIDNPSFSKLQLEEDKPKKIIIVKQLLKQKIEAGFECSATGENYLYPFKIEDQIERESHARKGIAAFLEVRSVSRKGKRIAPNGRIKHTPEQVSLVIESSLIHLSTLKECSGKLIVKLEQGSEKEVKAIKPDMGWPV